MAYSIGIINTRWTIGCDNSNMWWNWWKNSANDTSWKYVDKKVARSRRGGLLRWFDDYRRRGGIKLGESHNEMDSQ